MSNNLNLRSNRNISDAVVARTAQFGAFGAAVVAFPCCLLTAAKMGTAPYEIFLGVILGGILSIALVVLGMIIPLAMTRRD